LADADRPHARRINKTPSPNQYNTVAAYMAYQVRDCTSVTSNQPVERRLPTRESLSARSLFDTARKNIALGSAGSTCPAGSAGSADPTDLLFDVNPRSPVTPPLRSLHPDRLIFPSTDSVLLDHQLEQIQARVSAAQHLRGERM
jgi:hypothetical protein